jgi:hypothetical protein
VVLSATLPIPKTNFYKSGSWSELEDWETELKPFYQQALKMLGASKIQNCLMVILLLKRIKRVGTRRSI